MLIRQFLRFFLFAVSFRIVEEGGGGATPPAPVADATPAVADTPAAPSVSTPAPAPTMLDAINAHFTAKEAPATPAAPGQPRDEQGRFAPKDANGVPVAAPALAPVAPGAPVAAAPKPPAAPAVTPPGDELAMPEGLQPKAQERFQRLAETVKTTTAERDEARQQVSYVREAFQQHGVNKEQFEQAVAVIGMMNRGDMQGALRVLDEQRRHIALALGQPLPGVDALSEHPDLRQAVDGLQMTEQTAMELARARAFQAQQQRQTQQVQATQQAQQQEQQAVQAGLQEVDELCRALKARDMDYDAIEQQLQPVVKDLLAGLPPNRWKNAIQTQYDLLKRVASSARTVNVPPAGGGILRPTGQASPGTAPKNLYEAMWGPKG